MAKRLAVGGVCVVVAVGFGALALRMRAQDAELARLRADVAAMRSADPAAPAPTTIVQYVTQTNVQPAPSSPPAVPATGQPPMPGSMAPMTRAEMQEQNKRRTEAQRAACEDAFHNEPTGSAWARTQMQRLRDIVPTRLSQGSQLRELDCRASTCRMAIESRDEGTFRADFEKMMIADDGVWRGPFFATQTESGPDGHVVTVTYLVAEGGALPRPQS